MTKPDESTDPRRFLWLLKRHAELFAQEGQRLNAVLHELLPRFLEARKQWAEAQRATADEFNLFEVMEVGGDEVRHSKILAWLLDHRIEQGTHAQGNLGFRLFLEEFGRDLGDERLKRVLAYAKDEKYWIHTELSGDESRVDIEIGARGKFLIHIENKIHSFEGDDQTEREWRDMQVRAQELGVVETNCHALFLTLDAGPAKNPTFRSIGWSRVARVLDQFAKEAQPQEVQLFARHYAKAIRKLCVIEREEPEVDHGKIHGA